MKRYYIEYIKGGPGVPDFERVTLAGDSRISGSCYEFDSIPNVIQMKSFTDNFNFEYFGEFEPEYQWQDFREEWHTCDRGKFTWCKENNKPTRIIMKFVS